MFSTYVFADLASLAQRLEGDCRVMRPRLMSADVPREIQADELVSYGALIGRLVHTVVLGGCLSEMACREALELGEQAFGRGVGIEPA